MSHYAHITNNIVDSVIVAEADLIASLPDAQDWIQTSYNTLGGLHYSPDTMQPDNGIALRGNYAGIGFTYDRELDAFIPPIPDGYLLNTSNYSPEAFWVDLNNGNSWCKIAKNASSSIEDAINKKFNLIKFSARPTGTCHAIIRDPIDRFISAFAMNLKSLPQLDIDSFISWLISQNKEGVDPHFRLQTLFVKNISNITYYDFAKDLTPIANILDLDNPLPFLNKGLNLKPVLTSDQIAKLQQYYADDVELYNKVSST